MSVKRKFKSIQAVESDGSVTLVALGDDGTAWTARTYVNNGYMENGDLEWKPITGLPEAQMSDFFGFDKN